MLPLTGYKEALRKVLSEAVHNANYRKRLLSNNRSTAQQAINQLVSDENARMRILNVLYGEGDNYKQKNISSKAVIKLMAFVCCSLKAQDEAPTGPALRALYFPLSAQDPNSEFFESIEDWESPD